MYINHGSLSVVKGDEKDIYLDFVILGQIMPIANPDPKFDIDNYVCKDNEVIIYSPVITTQLEFMAVLLKKLVTSPFEEILVRGISHMDIIRKKVLYFFHQ